MSDNLFLSRTKYAFQSVRPGLSGEKGNILVYIVIVMVIFAVLGAAMVSLFSTSTGSSATANESRRAFYLAEAGLRYGLSELRQKGFSTSNIATLNTTEYKMPPSGNFDITIFGAWFKSPSNQSVASGALSVEIDKGKIPPSFFEKTLTVPAFIANLYLVVASLDPGSADQKPIPAEVAKVNGFSYTVGNDTSFTFDLADDFVVGKDKDICMAIKPASGRTFTPSGDSNAYFYLGPAAGEIFPKIDGSFLFTGRTFYYKTATKESNGNIKINNIISASSAQVDVQQSDYILLAPNNYFVTSKGTSGQVTFGGDLDNAASLADHSYHSEPDIELDISKVAQRESNESFITGETENNIPYLKLSGSTGFGATWYNQNLSLGGLGGLNGPNDYYCSSGACLFKSGLRAFFTLEFSSVDGSPSGDGLIFALLNGTLNSNASIGGDYERSELLGYSGDGRLPPPGISYPPESTPGLFPPKIGLEFDTKVNLSDTFENKPVDFCNSLSSLKTNTRNDPNFAGRDSVQYVFWGNNSLTAACRDNLSSYDDNRHNAEIVPESVNWSISIGTIESSPTIAPDGTIFVGTIDGFLYAFNPDGTRKTGWSSAFNTNTGAPVSTPVIVGDSPNYTIYAAAANELFALDPNKNEKSNFPVTVSGAITGKPAVGSGSDKTIYLTTSDNINKFGRIYAITPNGNLKPASEWPTNPILLVNPSTPPVITPPVISNNNSRLYVALRDNSGTLYSIRTSNGTTAQQRPLGAKIDKSVGVGVGSVPEGMVYVATNDKLVYALYGDNLLATPKWTTISFAPDEAYSSTPAASSDGSTVYIGSFDDKLYAINAENGILKWDYPAAGNVQSTPYVDSSNIVYFGSDIRSSADRRNVYALYGLDKSEKWRFETTADVRGTPAVSPDGTVYIGSFDSKFYCINQFANPKGFRNLRITSSPSNTITGKDVYDLDIEQQSVVLDSGNEYHWLKGAPSQNKKLWAVRIEVTRNPITVGVPGEYTLKTWIRQCNNNTDCDNIYDTFYEDTRVNYPTDTKPPLLTQTIQLPTGDHNWFNSFLFGFTSARDAADDQFATIRNFQLSFIRPNDPIAERNPLIPISDPDPNLP